MKIGNLINMVRSNIPKDHPANINTTDRYIYNVLSSVRARLIEQELKREKKISEWNYTILDCVEIIKVPAIQCDCYSYLNCDTIQRTKYKIPKPFRKNSHDLIDWIKTLLGENINIITNKDITYSKGNKYAKSITSLSAFIENGYLYFPEEVPKIIRIKLLPEKLEDVDEFISYCEETDGCNQPCIECGEQDSEDIENICLSMFEKEFPIDDDLIDALVTITRQRVFGGAVQDVYAGGKKDKQEEEHQENE